MGKARARGWAPAPYDGTVPVAMGIFLLAWRNATRGRGAHAKSTMQNDKCLLPLVGLVFAVRLLGIRSLHSIWLRSLFGSVRKSFIHVLRLRQEPPGSGPCILAINPFLRRDRPLLRACLVLSLLRWAVSSDFL